MRAFIVLGSLIVLGLLAALIGPLFVDWTAYRTQFEAEASRLLGQRVEVRGSAAARLLPFPSVTFGDVVVGEPNDPVLTVRSFRMDAELAPYLSGEIRIFDMRLEAPRLTLPIQADGTVRWPITTEALGGGTAVVLEHVAIVNGSAVLEDRRVGQSLRLDDIDAQLSASSLAGPFAGTATLLANGEPLGLTLSTGLATGEGTLPVRVTAQSTRANLVASLDAVLSSGEGKPLIDGRLQVASPLAPPPDGTPADTAPPTIRATARIEAATALASLSEMRIEVGAAAQPYVVEGGIQLTLGAIPHFDLQLTGQPVDVDRLAPVETTNPTFAERVAGLRTLVERIPRPDIPGRVQLSLPLVTIGDTDLRELTFTGSPTDGGWSIDTLALDLPGRARLEASGIARLGDDPSFAGSLLLGIRQPAAFFNWAGLGGAPDLVRLTRAGLSSQVELSGATQRLDALELDLDGRVLRGSIQRAVRPEGTSNEVELSGGAIDLRPLAVLFAPAGAQAVTGAERYDVQFDAGPVTFGSYEAAHLAADFTLANGTLDISDANADDIAGASVHVTGTMDDLFGAPRPDLAIDIVAETPDRLLSLVSDLAPESPLVAALQARSATLRPLTLAGTLASPPGAQTRDLLLALSGSVGGTRTDVRLALENGLAAQSLNGRFGLDLALENADAGTLLAQLGRPILPIGGLPTLRVAANLSGAPSVPVTGSVTASAGDARLTGNGTVTLGTGGIEGLDGRLSLAGSDLSPWLTTLGLALGQPIEGLPAEIQAALRWTPARWQVSDLAGSVAESRVAATLAGAPGEPVSGTINAADVSGPWLQTLLVGTSEGGLDARFGAGLLPHGAFDLTLRADRIGWDGDALRGVAGRVSSDGTQLRVADLAANVGNSPVALRGALRNLDGVVNLDIAGSFGSWHLDGSSPLRAVATGEIAASGGGRSLREVLASLNGSGRLQLEDATLLGLSPDVLAPITLAADSQTDALGAETVAQLLRETTDGASFPLGTLDLPFRLGAGSLQVDQWTVLRPEAVLSGTVGASLSDGALSGLLTLRPTVTDVVADAEPPRIDYRIGGTLARPVLDARTEALVSYFGVRAFQREQARVEALREELAETARLRREARLYRERATIRDETRNARIAAENAERERVERERLEQERREREAAAAAASATPEPAPPIRPLPDLSAPVVPAPAASVPAPSALNGLPGVRAPERF